MRVNITISALLLLLTAHRDCVLYTSTH